MEYLHECNHLSTADGDKAIRQYNSLIENKGFLKKAKKFSIQDNRLDGFYARIFDFNVFIDLENVAWIVSILSHGNAHVESGFFINGDILVENMPESAVVAQRLVYGGYWEGWRSDEIGSDPWNGRRGEGSSWSNVSI